VKDLGSFFLILGVLTLGLMALDLSELDNKHDSEAKMIETNHELQQQKLRVSRVESDLTTIVRCVNRSLTLDEAVNCTKSR
jgi:hypothetical protein